MRNFITAITLFFLTVSANASGEVQTVSLMNLIVTPERFDGKEVDLVGYVIIGRERDSIWFHKDDALHENEANSLWLNISEKDVKKYQKLSRTYVRIIGIFRANEKGSFGVWSGGIDLVRMKPTPRQ